MNDHDDARDLHAALGGLLVDEPTAPWSAQDDVARGRALQRRRRTRTLGGIGLVAALALVLGTLGPWRPFAAQVQPAGQPPLVEGVSQDWLGALRVAFFENRLVDVDWSASSVVAEDDGGFSLDLALVPAIVTDASGQRVEADPTAPGEPATRALVHWSPTGGEGPVLAQCRQPECARLPEGSQPGYQETGGRWTVAGARPQDTFVLDRTYAEGGTLEIAAIPLVPSDESSSGGVMSHAFIRAVLDDAGSPAAVGSVAADLPTAVTDELEALGWVTLALAGPDTEPGSPEVKTWNVVRADSSGTVKAKLVLRTWDATSFAEGPVPQGRALDACNEAKACGMTDLVENDCSSGPCWSRMRAVVQEQYDVLPVGTEIVSTWSLSPRAGVELAVVPPSAEGTAPDPLETAAFLSQAEQGRLLGVVQRWLLAQPDAVPSPTATPTSPAGTEPAGIAAVTRVLEGFGFRVNSAQGFSGRDGWYFDVDVDPTSDNPVDAVLTLAFFPEDLAVGTERVAVEGSVMNGCDESTCAPVQSINAPCPSTSCFGDWATTTTDAYDGVDPGTLVVFRSDGSRAVEAVVGVRTCPTCAPSRVGGAFLTLEQTQQVLTTAFAVSAERPSPTEPSTITACSPGEVKLIPATGAPVAVTGARGGWIEIHARNPEVECLATAPASVSFVDTDGTALTFRYRQGVYQSADLDSSGIEVSQAIGPSRFALTKYRCDGAVLATAAAAYVTLEGWDRSVAVELPPGFGIERCTGAVEDPGNTVYVSNLTSGSPEA